jgi:hypothetical protein
MNGFQIRIQCKPKPKPRLNLSPSKASKRHPIIIRFWIKIDNFQIFVSIYKILPANQGSLNYFIPWYIQKYPMYAADQTIQMDKLLNLYHYPIKYWYFKICIKLIKFLTSQTISVAFKNSIWKIIFKMMEIEVYAARNLHICGISFSTGSIIAMQIINGMFNKET